MAEKKNSKRVRAAWARSGLTYDELAELTGQKRNSIACWITGQRNPSDVTTAMIEEKVSTFLNGGGEYINKTTYRDEFAESVRLILNSVSLEQQCDEIMKAFDKLPTVSIRMIKGR